MLFTFDESIKVPYLVCYILFIIVRLLLRLDVSAFSKNVYELKVILFVLSFIKNSTYLKYEMYY